MDISEKIYIHKVDIKAFVVIALMLVLGLIFIEKVGMYGSFISTYFDSIKIVSTFEYGLSSLLFVSLSIFAFGFIRSARFHGKGVLSKVPSIAIPPSVRIIIGVMFLGSFSSYIFAILIGLSLSIFTELDEDFLPMSHYMLAHDMIFWLALTVIVFVSMLTFTRAESKKVSILLISMTLCAIFVPLFLPHIVLESPDIDINSISKILNNMVILSQKIIPLIIIATILILIAIVSFCFLRKSIDEGNRGLFILVSLGVITGNLITLLASFLMIVFFGSSFDNNFKSSVVINDKEYGYNIHYFSAIDHEDSDTEFLIAAYAGQGIHNANEVFDYLASEEFGGDRKKSIELIAKINLNNSTVFSHRIDNFLAVAKSGVTVSDAIRGLIQSAIYDNAPLPMVKKTLKYALEGNYQGSVDAYINDILNGSNRPSLLKKEKMIESGLGSPAMISMIKAIVQEDLAYLDFDKIKDPNKAADLKEAINDNSHTKTFSDEKVDEWFDIFGIK